MSVSAVNNVSAPRVQDQKSGDEQVAKAKENEYSKALEQVSQMNDKFVHKDDIKTPGQVVASVGFAGVKTFLSAASSAVVLGAIVPDKVKDGIVKTVKGLIENKKAKQLVNAAADQVKKLPKNKLTNMAANVGRNIMNFVKNTKNLPIIAGLAATVAMVPAICKRDNNGDGIKDIAQKSQSAYDNFQTKSQGFLSGAKEVADIIKVLS